MGQPIVVVEKPSVANPGMVRFETNRALTGMGHERYVAGTEVRGDRPPDELARRLLAHDSVDAVHVNGSVVTVDLAKGRTSEGLKEAIEGLYIHYPPTAEGEGDDTDEGGAVADEAAEAPAAVEEPAAAEDAPAEEPVAEDAPVEDVPAADDVPAEDAPASEEAVASEEAAAEAQDEVASEVAAEAAAGDDA